MKRNDDAGNESGRSCSGGDGGVRKRVHEKNDHVGKLGSRARTMIDLHKGERITTAAAADNINSSTTH